MEYIKKDPLIICICGKASSGKSTVSNYLENMFKNDNKRVIVSPYTKYLKKYISDVMGIIIDDRNKPRDLLQQFSSQIIKGELKDSDFFIRRQIEDINFYSYFMDVILIDDVRFPREIEILKDKYLHVYSIGVVRNDCVSNLTYGQKNDITEISLDSYDKYDYLIKDINLNSLQDTLAYIVEDIRKKVYDE